ncbi:hypothetical protein CEN45_01430 [Fischerella thermalis CCMEE 5198]|jgi:rhodanese-related sulfurtransferase|uniref:rhodanese-like domain-containing protein n=1 Tax=Fischerella thermalis TaxID=372787 RepID=UPI000CBCBE9F|nr:rhodanese-like domain-containing protein [Fischerella thermalis]PLZ90989.1 hypothetical protein CI594_18450 [Fischerella thermalis CCMEE 5196]PMB27381.1 hypothetical protein CEN45_01430 [Fischerella thermalis CCMEE 5198]PMB53344.1 hypothetical protein CEN39_04930 [Fischerella thermalis CCMEE 5201]
MALILEQINVEGLAHSYLVGDDKAGVVAVIDPRRDQAIATYCGTGYRASIAASLLQKRGFEKVINVPGSWIAWKAAGLPVAS